MSGFSRICYHGVPRIVEESWKEPVFDVEMEKIQGIIDGQLEGPDRINGFKEVVEYYKCHRLNLNIRQVWARKEKEKEEEKDKDKEKEEFLSDKKEE